MRIKTISSKNEIHEFAEIKWDLAFHGEKLDQRTSSAVDLCTSNSEKYIKTSYLPEQPDRLTLDNVLTLPRAWKEAMAGKKRVLLETTSLGTIEVLLLLKAAKSAGLNSVDCLYVEPLEYTKDVYLNSSWSREYSLSETSRLEGVRGFGCRLSEIPKTDGRLVVFLGFEGARLAGACEQEETFLQWKKHAIFGVPGYAPGWEMNSMANNVDTLVRHEFESVKYCPASSVSGAYDILLQVHREGRSDNPHTVIAPFGTKPHGIATAIFLVEHSSFQESSLLYDHPGRTQGRSSEVRRWHIYSIHFD